MRMSLSCDLDVDLVGLGQHRDGRSGGVDAAAGFGGRHPLHAMHAAFVLEPAVGAAALDADDDVLDAALAGLAERHQLDLPALALGKARVQRYRSPANSAASSPPVPARISSMTLRSSFGILRDEQQLQLVGEALLADVEIVELLEREVAHLGIAALDQLFGAGDLGGDRLVLAVLLDERLDLGERLGLLAVLVGIALHLRGAERRHQLLVLGLGRCNLVEQI